MPTKEEALAELYARGKLTDNQLMAVQELARRGRIKLPDSDKVSKNVFRVEAMSELAEEIGPLQAFLIGTGKGFYNIGRGLGITDPPEETETEAMAALKEERPYTTGAGEIVGEASPFLIPGTAAGRIASVPLRVLASGAVGGAEGGIISRGIESDVAAGVGMGTAIGVGAEILFPVLGKLGRKIFQRITGRVPKGAILDAAGKPTQELKEALDAVGMSFEDLTEDAAEVIMQQAPRAKTEQVARAALFTEEGIPATRGEITKGYEQLATEQRLIESVQDTAAEPLRQFKLKQSEAIKENLRQVGFDVEKEEAGELIHDALIGRKKLLRTQKNELYKEASDRAKGISSIPKARGAHREPWEMTGYQYLKSEPLPPIDKIPQKGQFPAVMTDDGSIYVDTKPQASTHILFIKKKGIPPERLKSGGWIKDGVYESTVRSDTSRYAEQMGAKKRIEHRKLVSKALSEGKPVPESVLKEYPELKKALPDKIPIFTDSLKEAVPDADLFEDLAITAPQGMKSLDQILTKYGIKDPTEESLEKGFKPTPLTIDNFERFRKTLNAIERGDNTGAVSIATSPIKEALDKELAELGSVLEKQGVAKNIITPLLEARKTVRKLKTEFSPQSIMGRIIDTKKDGVTQIIEASKIYDKLIGKASPIEHTRRLIKSLSRSGEKGKQAISSIQATTIMDLIDAGFGTESRKISGVKVFNPIAFKNRIKNIGPDKLKAIFANEKQVLKKLNNIEKIATELVPPSGAVPKGSASVIMDLSNTLGLTAISHKMPGGTLLIGALKALAEPVKKGAAVKKALRATPETEPMRLMIEQQFSGIASALGIAATIPLEEKK